MKKKSTTTITIEDRVATLESQVGQMFDFFKKTIEEQKRLEEKQELRRQRLTATETK